MTDTNIKKGCIARCGLGLLGLVTSERKEITRYGAEAWIGIQLSPDKAGQEWCSKNPTFIAESIDSLLDGYYVPRMNYLKRMVELTVSLHALIVCDMGESEEADNICDQMDIYWDLLEQDQEWLNDFSASLYSVASIVQPMKKCSEEIDRLRKEIKRLKSE